MTLSIRTTISGDNIADVVRKQMARMDDILANSLTEEAETIRARSMEIVPVDQGVLRASAMELGLPIDRGEGGGPRVTIGYGGAAASYALIQHENPDFRHTEGRTWKYLEKPFNEALEGMEQRLGESVRRQVTGQGGGEAVFGDLT